MTHGAIQRSAEIRLIGLTHRYGGAGGPALADVHLDLAPGASLALVGPADAGKTTVLRLVAGLEVPTGGRVLVDGVEPASLPAARRPVAAVFGRYSLYPFLDVTANVAFGLRGGAPELRGRAPATPAGQAGTARRVREALDLVRMGAYARRRPAQLSAAHQQRVAIARALVLRPRVLVLDEPLGMVDDEDLRVRLAEDLRALHRQLGITLVYATRSAGEASAVAERVAVLAAGRLVLEAQPGEEAAARPAGDVNPDREARDTLLAGAALLSKDAGAPAA
jgi:spermidine/putrescine transport system ATP-binding protein